MNLTKSKIFLIGCLSFIVGIAVASFLPLNFFEQKLLWFNLFAASLVLTIIFWQFTIGARRALPLLHLLFLFLAMFFLAIWRYGLGLPINSPDKIWYYNNQTVSVIGRVNKEADVRQTSQKLEIKTERLNLRTGGLASLYKTHLISGKILVTTNLYPEYNYGDELEITCQLIQPEKFNEFAYDRYLARYDIYSVCYYPKIELLKTDQGNWFYKNTFLFKHKLIDLIDQGLNEPESSLAGPIIFGGQKGLSDEIRQNFSRLGLTHILAVSGFNITILAAMTMSLLLAIGLNRSRAFYLATLILFSYVILVGLPASAMRAGLMGFLVLWALNLGRLNKLTNSLVLAAAILLLANPKLLRDDIGFQLSFLAITGLVYIYPILDSWLGKIKLPWSEKSNLINSGFTGIKEISCLTIAAQIFTWPIMAYNFSQVSLIAPLANLFIIWAVPFLTIAIIAALPLSWLLPGLAFLFFLPTLLVLKYILAVTELLARIPFGYIEISNFWWGWVIIYYLAMISWVMRWKIRNKHGKIISDLYPR